MTYLAALLSRQALLVSGTINTPVDLMLMNRKLIPGTRRMHGSEHPTGTLTPLIMVTPF